MECCHAVRHDKYCTVPSIDETNLMGSAERAEGFTRGAQGIVVVLICSQEGKELSDLCWYFVPCSG